MVPGSWIAGGFALAAVPPALLLVLVWRQRTEPGARFYAAMLCVMVVYNLLYAVTLLLRSPSAHEVLGGVAAIVKLSVTVPWVLFALEYTGRGRYVSRSLIVALTAVPVIGGLLMLSPAREGLLVQGFAVRDVGGLFIGTFENGPLWNLLALFGFGLLLAGLAMLLEFVISDRSRYGFQAGILALAGFVPGLTTLVHVGGTGPIPGLDLTALGYAAVAPLVGYGLIRYDLFGFVPATLRIGKATAIDDIGDAVVIVDGAGRIVDLNERAAALFECRSETVTRTPIERLLGSGIDLTATTDTVTVETRRGNREFDVTVSPVEGANHRRIGYTLVLHDVTHEKHRQQRLAVLNRVLRHNLRNGMNAILGYSNRLAESTPSEDEWMHDRIQDQSAHLVELSERASAIDRVTDPSPASSTVDVRSIVDDLVLRLGEAHPSLDVSRPSEAAVTFRSDPRILEETLYFAALELLSNVDADRPHLAFDARRTNGRPGWLTLTVTSNGDPIPPDERTAIERGAETPLDHGRDLDLWLVSWGVESLGGELEFVDGADGPGLRLTLPDLPSPESGPDG